jgi:hypothetical protein
MGFLNWFQEKLSSPQRALQAPSGRRPVTRREVPDRFVAGDVSEHRFADLTGRWGGFYVQCGAAHPVAANLVVASGRLTGTMTDRAMESERSVFEKAGLPPQADVQITACLRELLSAATVRYIPELSSESALEGSVQGREVSFRKTYPGEHITVRRIGDRFVGAIIERHVVHYRGELNDAGTKIEGNWWTEPLLGGGGRSAKGSFVLRRYPA